MPGKRCSAHDGTVSGLDGGTRTVYPSGMKRLVLILSLLCAPAFANEASRQEERDALFAILQSTENRAIAKAAQEAIWESWREAPDEDAQALFDLGMQRMDMFDNEGAVEVFDELILYAPDFAEGWNQRAFARFRMGAYEESLADIESTLQREPRHFGALSGKFRILMFQGRETLARATMREALAANPWTMGRRIEAPAEE